MSNAREWTLPNNLKIRVGDVGPFNGIQVLVPGGEWIDLARTKADAEALVVALCIEVKPMGGVR